MIKTIHLCSPEVQINAKDVDNNTPLHYARKNGYVEIAELLLQKNASKTARNSENETPFDLTGKNEQGEQIEASGNKRKANDIDDNILKTKVSRIEVTDENDSSHDDIGKKL